MLDTIEECDKELEEITLTLRRLFWKRRQILARREFLGGKKLTPRSSYINEKTFEIIKHNPGLNGRDIAKLITPPLKKRQMDSSISNLRLNGRIENRGKHGLGARWYTTDAPDTPPLNTSNASSTRQQIYQLVAENPGLNGRDIFSLLEDKTTQRQVSTALNNLRLDGEIENRGNHGIGARWYTKSVEKLSPIRRTFA
jgi:hypothetical protein